jgi:lysophospholipase L1-like esterase
MARLGSALSIGVALAMTGAAFAGIGLTGTALAQPTAERGASLAALSADARDQAAPTPEDVTIDGEEPELVFGEDLPIYDPSGRALRPLHDALRRVEAGADHARIVFYGASHVAADIFPNAIRSRLQERFGDAGHGFLMPARPWRHYRHLGGMDVESSRRWEALRVRASTRDVDSLGVAGMAVESESSNAWGRIDTGGATASRFVLFYMEQPGGGSFDVRIDGQRAARISTAAEAVGAGVRELTTTDAHHVLEVRPRGNGPVRLFGVSVEREQPGVIVDNMGINGARASSHLLWQEEIHREYMRRMRPDLVVLAYGTNETGDDDRPIEEYEGQLRSVVARLRSTVPNAACMLIGPSDRPMRDEEQELVDRPRTAQIVDVQRRVSRDFGCAFFDLVAFGGGPLSMVRWAETDPTYAQPDLVHFTGRGYLRLGEVLHERLVEGYDPAPQFEPALQPAVEPAGASHASR